MESETPKVTVSDYWFGAFLSEWDRNTMPKTSDRTNLWFNPSPPFIAALRERYESECTLERAGKPCLDNILLYDTISRIIFK